MGVGQVGGDPGRKGPRLVLRTKPECVRKQRDSENVVTIKDSSRRRSLAPARRRGEENALVLLLRRNSRLEPPQPALPRSRNPSGRADRHPLPGKPRRGLLVRLFSRWAAELVHTQDCGKAEPWQSRPMTHPIVTLRGSRSILMAHLLHCVLQSRTAKRHWNRK